METKNFNMIVIMISMVVLVAGILTVRYDNEQGFQSIKQQIDSCFNSKEAKACEQFNRSIDSLLYKSHGPYCPTCGQKLRYYGGDDIKNN